MHAQHFLKGEFWAISALEVNIDYLMSTSKTLPWSVKCYLQYWFPFRQWWQWCHSYLAPQELVKCCPVMPKHLLLPVIANVLLPRWMCCCRSWRSCVHKHRWLFACLLFKERWSQTLLFTIVFHIRSGLFACLVEFRAPLAQPNPQKKLWLEIHRIVCWHCLYIVCMIHGRTTITILVAG